MRRVMVIDDSENDLLFTRIVLERSGLGAEVLEYERASDALAALRAGQPGPVDVILLDINMPGMNGFEFLEAYERLDDAQRAGAVVVMLTSSPDPADHARAMHFASVRGYVTKPLDVETARGLVALVGA